MTDISTDLMHDLARSDDHYVLCWQHARDAMFVADAETGLIIDANMAAEVFTGYRRDALIGMHHSLLHPSAERVAVCADFRHACENSGIYKGYHLLNKQGLSVPVEISSSRAFAFGERRRILGTFREVTEQASKEHRLATQNWALSAYSSAALALGQAETAESLMQAICDAIAREPVYVLAWVGVAEETPGLPVRIAAAAGEGLPYLDGLHVSWSAEVGAGQGPTGLCIRSGERQIIGDMATSPIFGPWRERAQRCGMRSSASIPFQMDGDKRGALMVYAVQPNAFEDAAIEVFQGLAKEMGHGLRALVHRQLLAAERMHVESVKTQLTESLAATITAMALAMEKRDPYTAGHEFRVGQIAYAIGRELGWDEGRLRGLKMAAQVHDIGKISVPSEILTKPSRLSAAERALISEHPITGYEILKGVPFIWPIAEMVRQHHEKLDGSGYPLGLKGDAILPESRVLAVADIVESMASFRPYRPAMGIDVALAEIESQAGSKLDSEVVAVCLSLFRDKHFLLPPPY